MKTLHSVIASEFKLALEASVIDRAEIVRWADDILASEDYDDLLAEISLSAEKTDKDVIALLGEIATPDDFSGLRRMLGRMHAALEAEPARLPEFTAFLERLWIRHDYTLPKDLHFIIGIEDEYQLAEERISGFIDNVRNQLLDNLARFRHIRTE